MGQWNPIMRSGSLLGGKQASISISWGGEENTWALEPPPSHTQPPIKQLGAEAAIIGNMVGPAAQGPPLHQQPFSHLLHDTQHALELNSNIAIALCLAAPSCSFSFSLCVSACLSLCFGFWSNCSSPYGWWENCSVCKPGRISCGCCVLYDGASCRNPRVRIQDCLQYLNVRDTGCSLLCVSFLNVVLQDGNCVKYSCMFWRNNSHTQKQTWIITPAWNTV